MQRSLQHNCVLLRLIVCFNPPLDAELIVTMRTACRAWRDAVERRFWLLMYFMSEAPLEMSNKLTLNDDGSLNEVANTALIELCGLRFKLKPLHQRLGTLYVRLDDVRHTIEAHTERYILAGANVDLAAEHVRAKFADQAAWARAALTESREVEAKVSYLNARKHTLIGMILNDRL